MDLYEIRQKLMAGRSIYDLCLRVTFYARVSTEKDEQLHSLRAQVSYYESYIRANPHWEYVDGYVDEGISASSVAKRESFLQMVEDAKNHRFDFIITKEISRFSRNTVDSIQYTQKLLSCGVGVWFESDHINTLLPDSELRLTIMSSIAQEELRKLSERTKFGFQRAIEKGSVLGNDKIWGYTKQGGRLVVEEEEAKMVRLIFELYAVERMGIRAISKELARRGCWNSHGNPLSFSTIHNILQNPKYKGFYCGGKSHKVDYKLSKVKQLPPEDWVLYKDDSGQTVPAIVSEPLWDQANALLRRRSETHTGQNKGCYANVYAYSGKLVCAQHQVSFHRSLYRYASGNKEIWRCKRYAQEGRAGCTAPVVYSSELDMMLEQLLDKEVLSRVDLVQRLLAVYQEAARADAEQLEKLQAKVSMVQQRKDKLLDLAVLGRLSDAEFEQRNNRLNHQLECLQAQLDNWRCRQQADDWQERILPALPQAIQQTLRFEHGLSKGVVDSFIDRIEVGSGASKNEILCKVFLTLHPNSQGICATIFRSRKKTSVCFASYT